jgi:hypothetical protein
MVGYMIAHRSILANGPHAAAAVARILLIPGTLACPGRAR